MICNILWDVGGTLIDTRPAVIHALSRSLTETGTTVAMNEIDGLLNQSLHHCLETLSGRFGLDQRVLHQRFWKAYLRHEHTNGTRNYIQFLTLLPSIISSL